MANTIFSYALIALLLASNTTLALPGHRLNGAARGAPEAHTVTLAGVTVEIELPFEAAGFIEPAPDDALQVATAARWEPFYEVSLEAIPGAGDPSLATVEGVEQSLMNARAQQAPQALRPHRIDFFGQETESVSNRVEIHLDPTVKEPVIIHEWVATASGVQWILRVSYTPDQGFDDALLDGIAVRQVETTEQAPRTGLDTVVTTAATPQGSGDLPQPAWWDGDCDTNYYAARSGGRAAYPLEGVYRGVKACGPRPVYDNAPNVGVKFYPGAWGALEWQCVELSLRYLYLAYGVPPYSGHGKDIVPNYRGDRLVKVANGVPGKMPLPGDVLSYGPTTTYGHTSVVAASSVDATGNGTVTVIEQNSSAAGRRDLVVKDWVVTSSMTINSWLHEAKPNPPSNLAPLNEKSSVRLTWIAPANSTFDGYRIYRNDVPISTVGPTVTSYVDPVPLCTTNHYSVTAYYGASESDPTVTAAVDIDVPCKTFLPKLRRGK